MHNYIWAILLALMASAPAMAWQVDDGSDQEGKLFIAFDVDVTDTVELQVTCDELLDSKLLILLFTGEQLDGKRKLPPDTQMAFDFGVDTSYDFTGSFITIDDELVIEVLEEDDRAVRDVAKALSKSKPFTLSYWDVDWKFDNDGARGVMEVITDNCPA